MSTFLIAGVMDTASTSREPVLHPPEQETDQCEEDEEDDDDYGDDDVALHDCGCVCVDLASCGG